MEVQVKEKIREGDDICILRIPKTLNPEQFIGKTIKFNKKTKLKIDEIKYVITPNKEVTPFFILTKDLKQVTPVSVLNMQKSIKQQQEGEVISDLEQYKVSLPDNIKLRHPLFGPDYKKNIYVDEEIEKKLNKTIDNVLNEVKKKKKRRSNVTDIQEVEEQNKLKNHAKNKAKKHKNKIKTEFHLNPENTEISDIQFENSVDKSMTLKENRKKKKKNKTDLSHNEDEMEEHQRNQLIAQILETQSSSSEDKKKKKVKHKLQKEPTIVNSTIIPDLQLPMFNLDISQISQEHENKDVPHRNHHNMVKTEKINDDFNTIFNNSVGNTGSEVLKNYDSKRKRKGQIKQEPSSDFDVPSTSSESGKVKSVKEGKKLKKQHKASTDDKSLILDILNSVKSELSSPGHKRKRKHSSSNE